MFGRELYLALPELLGVHANITTMRTVETDKGIFISDACRREGSRLAGSGKTSSLGPIGV